MWVNGGQGSNIPARTKRIIRRRQNNTCNLCPNPIEEFDHIISIKAARIDRTQANHPDMIQGLCKPCHKQKTQAESAHARYGRRLRPPQPHPSEI